MSVFRQQASLLDTRLARQYQNSARLTPKAKEGKTGDGIIPGYSGRYRGEYLTVARAAAVKHGIPEDLFLRLVQKESGWNPQAVSPKGATGLAQLMPDTAARLGVDPTDPVDNKQMVAQMAQFSSLSSINEGNATLKTIAEKLDAVVAAQQAAATSLATLITQAAAPAN